MGHVPPRLLPARKAFMDSLLEKCYGLDEVNEVKTKEVISTLLSGETLINSSNVLPFPKVVFDRYRYRPVFSKFTEIGIGRYYRY